MAKINIEYDTKEKTLVATMDGKALKNLSQVMISQYMNYKDKQEAHIELVTSIGNEDEGMYERHCIYANHEEKTVIAGKSDVEISISEKLAKHMMSH